jgi:hypothetical protein
MKVNRYDCENIQQLNKHPFHDVILLGVKNMNFISNKLSSHKYAPEIEMTVMNKQKRRDDFLDK